MLTNLKALVKDESGVSALEYGLLAALIAVAIIAAVTSLGDNAAKVFNGVAENLKVP